MQFNTCLVFGEPWSCEIGAMPSAAMILSGSLSPHNAPLTLSLSLSLPLALSLSLSLSLLLNAYEEVDALMVTCLSSVERRQDCKNCFSFWLFFTCPTHVSSELKNMRTLKTAGLPEFDRRSIGSKLPTKSINLFLEACKGCKRL